MLIFSILISLEFVQLLKLIYNLLSAIRTEKKKEEKNPALKNRDLMKILQDTYT